MAKLLATSRLSIWGVRRNSAVPNRTIPIRKALYSWSAPRGNRPPMKKMKERDKAIKAASLIKLYVPSYLSFISVGQGRVISDSPLFEIIIITNSSYTRINNNKKHSARIVKIMHNTTQRHLPIWTLGDPANDIPHSTGNSKPVRFIVFCISKRRYDIHHPAFHWL